MNDISELFYAHMEADRIEAEDAYFAARPGLSRHPVETTLFRAGFERAYRKLWDQRQADPAKRWEDGFRQIAGLIVGPRTTFEIPQIVDKVREGFNAKEQSASSPESPEKL